MLLITSPKGGYRIRSVSGAAAWMQEHQPSYASIGETDLDSDTAEAVSTALVGLRVVAGEGEDRDEGRITAVDSDETVRVAWDSQVNTPAMLADLHHG